jgi:hypothetical protein
MAGKSAPEINAVSISFVGMGRNLSKLIGK